MFSTSKLAQKAGEALPTEENMARIKRMHLEKEDAERKGENKERAEQHVKKISENVSQKLFGALKDALNDPGSKMSNEVSPEQQRTPSDFGPPPSLATSLIKTIDQNRSKEEQELANALVYTLKKAYKIIENQIQQEKEKKEKIFKKIEGKKEMKQALGDALKNALSFVAHDLMSGKNPNSSIQKDDHHDFEDSDYEDDDFYYFYDQENFDEVDSFYYDDFVDDDEDDFYYYYRDLIDDEEGDFYYYYDSEDGDYFDYYYDSGKSGDFFYDDEEDDFYYYYVSN